MSTGDQIRKRVRITLRILGSIFLISGLLFILLYRQDVAGFAMGAGLVLAGTISLVWGLGASFAHRGDKGEDVEGYTTVPRRGDGAGSGR